MGGEERGGLKTRQSKDRESREEKKRAAFGGNRAYGMEGRFTAVKTNRSPNRGRREGGAKSNVGRKTL